MNRIDSIPCRAVVYAITAFTIAACGNFENQAAFDQSAEGNSSAQTYKREVSVTSMDLETQVEFSRNDLAQRLGVDLDSINLLETQVVTWRSGALGCPRPEMNYTQALVSGILIILEAHDTVYRYHSKLAGQPFYCPRKRVEEPIPPESEMGTKNQE